MFGQHAQPFVELGQPLFVLGVEGRAVPAELPQDMVVEPPGFGIVGWGDGRDPPIELLVQVQLVGVGGELGGNVGGDGFEFFGGVGAEKVEEHRRNAAQFRPAALQGLDRVFPRGRLGIRGDGIEFLLVVRHAIPEGRPEVVFANVVEWR